MAEWWAGGRPVVTTSRAAAVYIVRVSDLPAFEARLARLLEHRVTPVASVAEAAGVPPN
ncbi:hypothetical protein GCM10010399_34540 [Dactylosporangium fulvum]